MAGFKVGYFVGSLATKSINRLLAKALVRVAPQELQLTEISFKDLPLYSYDYDKNYPPAATAFKDAIAAVDAVLFVTPEYNRSIPGGLKNAIDWASRPVRQERVHTQTVRRHRNVARKDRHGRRAATSSQHSCVLQFATDECHRSIHSVRGRLDHRGWPRVRRLYERVPPELHGGVPRFHRTGVHRVTAQCLAIACTGEWARPLVTVHTA